MSTTIRNPEHYQVAFEQGTHIRRWRDVFGAESPEHAIQKCMRRAKPGAVKRMARTKPTLKVFVAKPNEPRHESGLPMIVHSFTLQLTATPT